MTFFSSFVVGALNKTRVDISLVFTIQLGYEQNSLRIKGFLYLTFRKSDSTSISGIRSYLYLLCSRPLSTHTALLSMQLGAVVSSLD